MNTVITVFFDETCKTTRNTFLVEEPTKYSEEFYFLG